MFTIFGKNNKNNYKFCESCDFVLELDVKRKNDDIRFLQLTDMQIIDASQRRTPDRLRQDEINACAFVSKIQPISGIGTYI